MKTSCLKAIAYVVGISSFVVAVIFIWKVTSAGLSFCHGELNLEASSQSGAFIGGIIGTILSAGVFFWTYKSLLEQRDEQRLEHLEQRFFLMINLHRQNVSELIFDTSGRDQDPNLLPEADPVHRGRVVFRDIFSQIKECREMVGVLVGNLRETEIYEENYLRQIRKNPFVEKNRVNPFSLALADISYCAVHYGVGKKGEKALFAIFRGKYKKQVIAGIVEKLKEKRAKHGSEIKYFGGHQFRLEHYFRHMYMSINYIDESEILSSEEKGKYVDILQSQLSNNEECLLFYHSLSQLGRQWEMNSRRDYITDYRLIRDISPAQLIDNVYCFYPKVFAKALK